MRKPRLYQVVITHARVGEIDRTGWKMTQDVAVAHCGAWNSGLRAVEQNERHRKEEREAAALMYAQVVEAKNV